MAGLAGADLRREGADPGVPGAASRRAGQEMSSLLAFFKGRLWLWELSALAWLLLLPYIMTAHGHLDWSGHALGRDFVNYWTAGQLVREGHALAVFTPETFLAAEH